IKMPGGYVISPADFASSLRHAAPELFSAIVQKSNDNPADRYTGMTAEMIALKDRSRRQILTDEERSRYT
ncbi:hypothetical protein, partial [Enterobacter hormaechei]|uniref:hypothetical protein n=1 Tax=Enterobacter hormaechei TaxID=158836 RepID=UPI001953E146